MKKQAFNVKAAIAELFEVVIPYVDNWPKTQIQLYNALEYWLGDLPNKDFWDTLKHTPGVVSSWDYDELPSEECFSMPEMEFSLTATFRLQDLPKVIYQECKSSVTDAMEFKKVVTELSREPVAQKLLGLIIYNIIDTSDVKNWDFGYDYKMDLRKVFEDFHDVEYLYKLYIPHKVVDKFLIKKQLLESSSKIKIAITGWLKLELNFDGYEDDNW